MGQFTQALADLRSGDTGSDAVNALFEATYGDLKRLAHERLRRGQAVTGLGTTALVHESYLRFQNAAQIDLKDRPHFMVYASKVMRSVIIDLSRRRLADRRGGAAPLVTLGTGIKDAVATDADLVRVDEALTQLAQVDPQLVHIVEMRYFAGLSVDDIAEHFGRSARTVFRQWEKARLVLLDALEEC